ncbi:hypothetical protein A2U01_0072697, partial [Trifolium medium]|nr:hypothetical protein [Trifolium medium]
MSGARAWLGQEKGRELVGEGEEELEDSSPNR